MRKLFLTLAICGFTFGDIVTLEATPENIAKFDQIIDIRTPDEWRETGIIPHAKTIQLINDKEEFLRQIKSQIDTTKPFAIICRSGRRSAFATQMIDSSDLNITNLDGGMGKLISKGYKTKPY